MDSSEQEVWVYERDNVDGEWGDKFTITRN